MKMKEERAMQQENKRYRMPAEWEEHEGTWLSWPHRFSFRGENYRSELDNIWVAITKGLYQGENVHILVFDDEEKMHVQKLLGKAKINMGKIDFIIMETDDVWIRDNGPIFVYDEEDNLVMTNWKFNGWGGKYGYELDNQVSEKISQFYGFPRVDAPLVLEGGGVNVNGTGTLMAALTSIVNDNRNPEYTKKEQENIISKHFGVDNFIWITGIVGEENGDEDTDYHIDGAACFTNKNTILYEYDPFKEDKDYLLEAYDKHYKEIKKCKTEDGEDLTLVPLPLTRKEVKEAGCKGSYLNIYIGNKAVLVPIYGDENDGLALQIIEGQFPGREIIGIDVCKLFPYGGMIHCVTQQQPINKKTK